MITIEHRWQRHGDGNANVCTNCGLMAVPQEGYWVSGIDCIRHSYHEPLPPCPLVPVSEHSPGEWRLVSSGSWYGYVRCSFEGFSKEIAELRLSGDNKEEMRANAALMAASPRLRDAAEATLLFHQASRWDDECAARWRELTGVREATTRALCDFVRRCLR
jgi:hypothetical protein